MLAKTVVFPDLRCRKASFFLDPGRVDAKGVILRLNIMLIIKTSIYEQTNKCK